MSNRPTRRPATRSLRLVANLASIAAGRADHSLARFGVKGLAPMRRCSLIDADIVAVHGPETSRSGGTAVDGVAGRCGKDREFRASPAIDEGGLPGVSTSRPHKAFKAVLTEQGPEAARPGGTARIGRIFAALHGWHCTKPNEPTLRDRCRLSAMEATLPLALLAGAGLREGGRR